MYHVAAYSNVGSVKESNQDSCCIEVAQTPEGDTLLLAVCDGVGGLSSGEVASASVVKWLSSWFERRYSRLLISTADDTKALFNRVQSDWIVGIRNLNQTLLQYGRDTNQRMGSTFTAILFFKGEYIIGHVGDCRVYEVSDGKLRQLTEDQTWVAREVARGTITPEQARSHPRKNIILQSVGTQEDIHPVFTRGDAAPAGSSYVVCCDGFRNELFDDEIANGFNSSQFQTSEDMDKALEDLAQLAMQRGERDNITAVLAFEQEGDDYGDPLVICKDIDAVFIEQEEEEPPTGQLVEQPSAPKHLAPGDKKLSTGNLPKVVTVEPAGSLAMGSVVAERFKIVGQREEKAFEGTWLVRDLLKDRIRMLIETPLQDADPATTWDTAAMLRYADLADQANIRTLWRVENQLETASSRLFLCEYIPGESLQSLIEQKEDAFPEDDVLNWGIQLCSTLALLHLETPPIVACDVRPGNVILSEDGTLCIADVASMREKGKGNKASNGKLERGYIAPELFVNEMLADERSDIYALGASLFYLSTGRHPAEYAKRLKLPSPQSINPKISDQLAAVIAKATKLDADDRYKDAAEMLAALQQVEAALKAGE